MEKAKKNKSKNKTAYTVFLVLMIVAAFVTVDSIINAGVATGLSIYGFKSAKKISNKTYSSPSSSLAHTPGNVVAFKEERLDLGARSDGYYYTIIRMVDGTGYPQDDGEFVVLKKSGSVPSVEYYSFYAETGQQKPYFIKDNLPTDDFSDMMDDQMIEDNPDIFENRTDMVFTVIDMDTDILKSPADFQKEKDDLFIEGVGDFMAFQTIGFLSVLGVILAFVLGVFSLITFIAFIVFLILFLVFLSKAKKENPAVN